VVLDSGQAFPEQTGGSVLKHQHDQCIITVEVILLYLFGKREGSSLFFFVSLVR